MRAALDLWAGVLGHTLYFFLIFGAALSVLIGILAAVSGVYLLVNLSFFCNT